MPAKLTRQEHIDRATGNIQGSVWALLQHDVTTNDIHQIVFDAVKEFGPSDQPAFEVQIEDGAPDLPDVHGVARAGYYANRGKAPMEWGQLKEDAILPQGRQSFWIEIVNAVYAAITSQAKA